ncbi:hypothetical protein RchiOBHm_Chr7g0233081 [Rosa chinensis]|uniref:Uncharacterized protein n=1 Tax=Rosa chinensis TaxID=74649 RepID=A0A2P6PG43_ROSCH|nr:hypothetical protein RchiOBHm_Chr7g0233081 [Rosa chinensis]
MRRGCRFVVVHQRWSVLDRGLVGSLAKVGGMGWKIRIAAEVVAGLSQNLGRV